METRRTGWIALALVVALAFVLRWRGVGSQLPQWTHLDGYVELVQQQYLRDPQSVKWPDMNLGYYPYATSALAAALPDVDVRHGEGGITEEMLAAAREPWVRIRLASILLSLGAVVGAFAIARRFVSTPFALLASALVATSLVHATFSAEQRPHGPASGTAALALWALLALRNDGRARSQLVAAAAVALALATLQTGAALLLSWAIAWWFRRERASAGREALLWAAGLALVALAAWLAYPFHFDERAGSAGHYETGDENVWMGGHALYTERLGFRGFSVMWNTFLGFDPWLIVLGGIAALAWGVARFRGQRAGDRERTRDTLVLLGYVLPFVVVFGVYDMTYDRFVLSLVPFVALGIAVGLEALWGQLPGRLRHPAFAAVLAVGALGVPLAATWRMGSVRASADTFEEAARWIEANVDAKSQRVLFLQNIDLPLLYERGALAELNDSRTLYWTAFQRNHPAPEGSGFRVARPPRAQGGDEPGDEAVDTSFLTPKRLRELGFDFVVALPPKRGGVNDADAVEALRALRKNLERVALFTPAEDEEKRARTLDFGPRVTETSTVWNLFAIRAFGPRIEIFRL